MDGDEHGQGGGDGDRRDGTGTRYYRSDVGSLRVVPAETTGRIVHEVHAVEARCPYEAFVDCYAVTVDYRPDERVVEIASLRRYVDQFAGVEISHEAFCETVFGDLWDRLAPAALTVTARSNRYHGIDTIVERADTKG
jgi:NADPH-dependent 7-cyano-7-deazaguanine reductase QueF